MSFKLPARRFYKVYELMERWSCSELDIKEAIIYGGLPVHVWVEGVCQPFFIDPGRGVFLDEKNGSPYWRSGMYRLKCFRNTDIHDGKFSAFGYSGNNLDQHKEFLRKNGLEWKGKKSEKELVYALVNKDSEGEYVEWSLGDVMHKGFVLSEDLMTFEKDGSAIEGCLLQEKPVTTKERASLLTTIAILCSIAKLDYLRPAKTAVVIKDESARLALSIGETTVENQLKMIPNAIGRRSA